MTPSWIQPESLTPQERIQGIEGSLRAFTFAWVGLVPVLGLPFALVAFVMALQPTLKEGDGWHAARRYRLAALWMSGLTLVVEIGAISTAILASMNE